jgi:hypothetical protein
MEDDKKQPLITKEQGALVAATFTAIVSAGLYLTGVAVDLDGRLDRLEEDAKVLISPSGSIVPSRESLESLYRTRALEQRVERLEAHEHQHR